MAKSDQLIAGLEKLYGKRKELDKQISDAEKKLIAEVQKLAKAAPVVKAVVKKAAGKAGAVKAAVKAKKPALPKTPLIRKP